jgi:hypothetical protein
MPFPKKIKQENVIVNGQPARSLGRDPKVVKPWKHPKKPQIDQTTFRVKLEPASEEAEQQD